jgi:tRNA (cmo5U34)-methyltransferase
MTTVDKHQPGDKWEFNAEVAEVFDDMLARSIPQYDVMRQACFDLGCHFVKPETDIVDLGCSRGGAVAPFVKKFGALNRYALCEISEPMRQATADRFSGMINTGLMRVLDTDLRKSYPAVKSTLTLCILTLQFTPIEYRLQIMKRICESLEPGGALLLVEKIIGGTSELDDLMISTYYDMKREAGYTQDDINRKRLSLEGVLVPLTATWNEQLLGDAGFTQVDCFWRWMNFAGWVAVR